MPGTKNSLSPTVQKNTSIIEAWSNRKKVLGERFENSLMCMKLHAESTTKIKKVIYEVNGILEKIISNVVLISNAKRRQSVMAAMPYTSHIKVVIVTSIDKNQVNFFQQCWALVLCSCTSTSITFCCHVELFDKWISSMFKLCFTSCAKPSTDGSQKSMYLNELLSSKRPVKRIITAF